MAGEEAGLEDKHRHGASSPFLFFKKKSHGLALILTDDLRVSNERRKALSFFSVTVICSLLGIAFDDLSETT